MPRDRRININIEKVKARHRELGLSVEDLADKSGIPHGTLMSWFAYQRKPSEMHHERLLKALECEITDIVDYSTAQFIMAMRQYAQATLEHKEYTPLTKANFARDMFPIYAQAHDWLDMDEGEDNKEVARVDWRNPDLYAFESDACMEVVNYDSKMPLVVSGPTRCGKTLRILEMIVGLHFANAGFRSLILRANAVDLSETIRRDLRDVLFKYNLDDPLSPVKAQGFGGARNFKTLGINGGQMNFGGMNRPGRVLGTSYNLIFCSQIEQFTEEQFNFLLTRCAGDCKGWEDADGLPRGLLIADANPDASDHWVKQYEQDERLKIINFTFTDNPLYYRRGEQTELGESVITQLDTSLSGIYHDRFFKGLWCDVEGRVFDVKDEHYLDESLINKQDYKWYRACDFGISAPSVCLWIGENKHTGSFYVHREFRKTHTDTIELASEINKHTNEKCLNTIIDNDEDKQKIFKRNGIASQMTIKNQHSIMDGIHLIQDALRNSDRGADGGLYFNRALRCNIDAVLVRDKKPLSVIDEMKTYAIDADSDKPMGSDHGIDALRYFMLWRMNRKGSVGFGGGGQGARKQSRV